MLFCSLPSNGESSGVNYRLRNRWSGPGLMGGQEDTVFQFVQMARSEVGQSAVFEVTPAVFVGMEFGGVGRQLLEGESTLAAGVAAYEGPTVGPQSIPDHDDVPAKVGQPIAQEDQNLLLANGLVGMKLQVPAQPTAVQRDRDAADGRDLAVVSRPLPEHGRPAA